MGKPYPLELRRRVVAHVETGHTHHSAAARFDVSVKFVNDMVKPKRETGALAPKRQGNPGIGNLTPHEEWVRAQVDAKGEITLDEMAGRLEAERDVRVDPSSVWRLFKRLGLTHKKDIQALERKRAKVVRERHIWIAHRQPFMTQMLERIGLLPSRDIAAQCTAGRGMRLG